MKKNNRYEAILSIKGQYLISVNQFHNLGALCRWLEDVNLELVDCEIVGLHRNILIDPYELLKIWRA